MMREGLPAKRKGIMSKVRVLCWTPMFLPDVGGIETLIAKVLPILS